MKPSGESALTLAEVVVILFILYVLAMLALPCLVSGGSSLTKGQMIQSLSNQKQLHLATMQMALDGVTIGDTNLGWPGDTGGSFGKWTRQLVEGNYLSTNDLGKLLSAPGKIVKPGKMPSMEESAQLVYQVSTNSPGNTVFLSTANFTNSPSGGEAPAKKAKPYGEKGFVIFRKAGDGAILQARQAGMTNVIGSYVPLCR